MLKPNLINVPKLIEGASIYIKERAAI